MVRSSDARYIVHRLLDRFSNAISWSAQEQYERSTRGTDIILLAFYLFHCEYNGLRDNPRGRKNDEMLRGKSTK
jgi:hypothetical protein